MSRVDHSVPIPPAADGFAWIEGPLGSTLHASALSLVASHLFTTRGLRFRGRREDAEWAVLAAALGVGATRLLRPRQVHGNAAVVVRRGLAAPRCDGRRPDADIILTDDPTVAIAVQVADCIPLLAADPGSGAVAAAHAGWRGTASGVAAAMVRSLEVEFGVRPADLVVALGPSIGPCCYEVSAELPEAFRRAGHAEDDVARWFSPGGHGGEGGRSAHRSGGRDAGEAAAPKWTLDLWMANREQLTRAGVDPSRVHLSRLCTAHHRGTFFSYRVEGAGTGRLIGVIRPRS